MESFNDTERKSEKMSCLHVKSENAEDAGLSGFLKVISQNRMRYRRGERKRDGGMDRNNG